MNTLDKSIFKTLRENYLAAVRDMALFPEDDPRHQGGERLAASTSHTAFSLFGAAAADKLREEGLTEWDRIRTLA